MSKKTYHQIAQQIKALEAEAEKLRQAEIADVVQGIKAAIDTYGLTATDLFGRSAARKGAKRGRPARAKYSDGRGNVWGGRGPRPQWLRDQLEAGRSLEDFLAGGGGGGTKAAKSKPGRKASGRKKRGGTVKYRDGSGNTWTGFGPRPGWVKSALAAGKSLDEFLI